MSQARQVNLINPHKIESGQRVHVKGLRPVSVFSVFWRTWASSWVQHKQVQSWIQENKHEAIVHGPGFLGAEGAASLVQDVYSGTEFLDIS